MQSTAPCRCIQTRCYHCVVSLNKFWAIVLLWFMLLECFCSFFFQNIESLFLSFSSFVLSIFYFFLRGGTVVKWHKDFVIRPLLLTNTLLSGSFNSALLKVVKNNVIILAISNSKSWIRETIARSLAWRFRYGYPGRRAIQSFLSLY